ncbi:MAG TPA: hypothetical protein VH575_30485 [Gemmataceae bacterium]|jgi:hypothetical protein
MRASNTILVGLLVLVTGVVAGAVVAAGLRREERGDKQKPAAEVVAAAQRRPVAKDAGEPSSRLNIINVMAPKYGAKGNGEADDTAAFQAAINDACAISGTVVVPPPPVSYIFLDSLTIRPPKDKQQVRIRIQAMGDYQSWQYRGTGKHAFLILHGLKECVFENINIQFDNKVSNTVCWSCEPTKTYPSMNNVRWAACRVEFGAGGNNIAWRMGQSSNDQQTMYSDQAEFYWDHCQIHGTDKQLGDVGWQAGGTQTTPQCFVHCSGSRLWRMYLGGSIASTTTDSVGAADTTIPVVSTTGFPSKGRLQINSEQIDYTGKTATTFTGCKRGVNGTKSAAYEGRDYVTDQYVTKPDMGAFPGAAALTWIAGGGGANFADFLFNNGGRYNIIGYQGEDGGRFLQTSWGISGAPQQINIQGCELATYVPADGICFLLNSCTTLRIANCNVSGNRKAFGAAFITQAGGPHGSVAVENTSIPGSDPCYTLAPGSSWHVTVNNALKVDPASGKVLGFFSQPPATATVQELPYASSITPDPRRGAYMTLNVTNRAAFTVKPPAWAVSGNRITFEITNSSDGAMGDVTWTGGERGYRLSKPFVAPANGKTTTIEFVWNGSVWQQV